MADKTTLQEAAQALFCSVADYLGERETAKSFDSKKYKTYEDFMVLYTPPGRKNINQVVNEAFKSNVSAPGVSLKQIETFLQSDKSWFYSSMNIAKKMIQEVDSISNKFSRIQNVNWANIFYVRGDQEVMGNISTLFTRANNLLKEIQGKEQAFGNINKWSPADIYFASPKAKTVLADKVSKREKITFDELNELIANLIDSGDLLPLSLKKQTKEVTIEKVNFTAGKGEVPYIFAGFGGKEADARSLIVEISKTDKSKDIVIRHDASTGTASGGTYKLEIRLKSARGGSLSGNKIVDTFKSIDSEFGAQFESTLADARVKFADEFAKRTKGITKATNPDRYRAIRDEVSKKYFTDSGPNKLIKDYLQKNSSNGKSTKLVKGIVVAAASGSDYSAKYVIAK